MTVCLSASQRAATERSGIESPSIATRENRESACELKFMVPRHTAAQIREWARNHLLPDGYGSGPAKDQYQITSIYFDTANFDVFHRNGSFARGKYRVRRYGSSGVVFLERKLRTKECLTKRRTSILLSDLERLESPATGEEWPGRWFARRLAARQIRPVCQVGYERTARAAMTQLGPVRLTIDEALRATGVSSVQFSSVPGTAILPDYAIVEMKFTVTMPTMFKLVIEEFALNPIRFSKYRFSAGALELATATSPAPRAEERNLGMGGPVHHA